jgi:hypothetical protein
MTAGPVVVREGIPSSAGRASGPESRVATTARLAPLSGWGLATSEVSGGAMKLPSRF